MHMINAEVNFVDLSKTGLFIAELRKQKNITQKELAERIGVTDKAVSRWETGKGFPDVSLLTTLAGELGVSVSEIVMGERIETKDTVTVEIMDKTVMDTLDYSQRERTGSERLKGIALCCAIIGICVLVLFGFYAQAFSAGFVYTLAAYVIIPLGIPAIVCVIKRERLWLSPILVFLTGLITTIVIDPGVFKLFHLVFISDYTDGSSTRTVKTILLLPIAISIFGIIICKVVEKVIEAAASSNG